MKKITSEEQFEKEVLKSKEPVLVDFYADWCQPCKQLDKIIPSLKIKSVKVDVMALQGIAGVYMVQTLPTTLFFKGGVIVSAKEGLQTKKAYESVIEEICQ